MQNKNPQIERKCLHMLFQIFLSHIEKVLF